jgi:hypothetical protein
MTLLIADGWKVNDFPMARKKERIMKLPAASGRGIKTD